MSYTKGIDVKIKDWSIQQSPRSRKEQLSTELPGLVLTTASWHRSPSNPCLHSQANAVLEISLHRPRLRQGFLRHGDTSTDGSSTGDTSFGDNSFSLSRHSDNATRRSEKGSDVAWILISRWPSLNRRTQPFKPGFGNKDSIRYKAT